MPRVAIGLAVFAFGVCFTWAVSTLFLSEPVMPGWGWFPTFVGVFPLMLYVIVKARRSREWPFGRTSLTLAPLTARLPLGLIILAGILFLTCWVLGLTAILTLRDGAPVVIDGAYYANNHGDFRPISEAKYHELQLAEQRVFTAVPAGFYVFCALLLTWLARRPTPQSDVLGATTKAG